MTSLSALSLIFGITLVIAGSYWVRYLKNTGLDASEAEMMSDCESSLQNRSHLWAYSTVTLGAVVIQYALF
jgi:hypothetical protein